MLVLRGHKYQQTCHSPGQTNLNGYEKKSDYIMDLLPPPPPPPPISYQWRMKNIHQEERKALLHDIEVYCKYRPATQLK